MQAIISPGYISGRIRIPPSKSMTQRVLAAALLHQGETIIYNMGKSDDELAALNIIQQLGAEVVNMSKESILIKGGDIKPDTTIIDCGESGLSARLFIPIIATFSKPFTIVGKGSLTTRPMQPILDVLIELGIEVKSNNGKLPISIDGSISLPDSIIIDGSISSQYLTGILFALSNCTTKKITVHVTDLKSKPYIDMSIEVLKQFGKEIQHDSYKDFFIDLQYIQTEKKEINIERDWSSAAFLMVAAAINGDVIIEGLNSNSLQADRAILQALQLAGVYIHHNDELYHIKKARALTAFDFDATHCPDLFPILSILASYCHGESSIQGIHRLIHKESNRLESIAGMLEQLDIHFSIEDDRLIIQGNSTLAAANIHSYNDHRIAMSAAIAAIGYNGSITITDAEVVSKSYVDFFIDISSLGINCRFL